MAGKPGAGQAMSLFEHWVVDCALKHNAAVKAALAIDPASANGKSAAEREVSRLTILLIQKLHALPELVQQLGPSAVFGPQKYPLSPDERRSAKL